MVKSVLWAVLLLTTLPSTLNTPSVLADESAERRWVRFYKANRALQTDRLFFTGKKGKQLGCHNLLKKKRVYKLVQFGFGHCKVYTAKDCRPDSLATAMREKDDAPSTLLAQGYAWYPVSDHPRGAKIRSWSCGMEQAPPPPKPKKKPKPVDQAEAPDSEKSNTSKRKTKRNEKNPSVL